MTRATPNANDLCRACGLCCVGVVHSHVALASNELPLARELSLRVNTFEEGLGFHLPCPQYQNNGCVTYQNRPRACVEYQCELLRRLLAGEVTLEESVSLITQAKTMTDRLWAQVPGGKNTPLTLRLLRDLVK